MDKTSLQDAFAQILTLLTTAAQNVSARASHEIPLAIQELLRWKFVEACVYLGMGVAGLVLGIVSACVLVTKIQQRVLDEEPGWMFLALPAAVGLLTGLINIFENLPIALQIWFAPRIYLLEWLKSQLK